LTAWRPTRGRRARSAQEKRAALRDVREALRGARSPAASLAATAAPQATAAADSDVFLRSAHPPSADRRFLHNPRPDDQRRTRAGSERKPRRGGTVTPVGAVLTILAASERSAAHLSPVNHEAPRVFRSEHARGRSAFSARPRGRSMAVPRGAVTSSA